MTEQTIALEYDEQQRCATLRFPTGRVLKVENVTREQAQRFHQRHAPEFAKRDCILHSPASAGVEHGD